MAYDRALAARVKALLSNPDVFPDEFKGWLLSFLSTQRIESSQLPKTPGARVYHNANQAIATATETALAFNSERFDTDAIHDTATNNSRLTCRTPGIYTIIGTAQWPSSPTSSQINIRLNGTTHIARSLINSADYQIMNVAAHYKLSAGDYVELVVRQATGGNLDIVASGNFSPEFSMVMQ